MSPVLPTITLPHFTQAQFYFLADEVDQAFIEHGLANAILKFFETIDGINNGRITTETIMTKYAEYNRNTVSADHFHYCLCYGFPLRMAALRRSDDGRYCYKSHFDSANKAPEDMTPMRAFLIARKAKLSKVIAKVAGEFQPKSQRTIRVKHFNDFMEQFVVVEEKEFFIDYLSKGVRSIYVDPEAIEKAILGTIHPCQISYDQVNPMQLDREGRY